MLSYRPLEQLQSEIRLVRFKFASEPSTHDSDSTSIQLELRHASLDDSDTRYAALSYVWGDATDYREIYVNDSVFRIGRNLHDALFQLRRMDVSSWLWIDSICIQQSDIEEKTWQVSLMRSVFSLAEMVYIWLGPGCPATDKAMEFISRIGPRALSAGALDLKTYSTYDGPFLQSVKAKYDSFKHKGGEGQRENQEESELVHFVIDLYEEKGLHSRTWGYSESNEDLIKGIDTLMLKGYWHRIWIIQEVALGREATIICGVKSTGLDEFDAVLTAIEYCMRSNPKSLNADSRTFARALSGNFYESTAMLARRFHQRGLDGREIRLGDILVQKGALSRPHYSATDPRDIVFGILGLVSEDQKLGLVVDYGMTVDQVFCKLTKALYRQRPNYFCLDSCTPREHQEADDHTPSWVPDWVQMGRYGLGVYPINHYSRFHAASPSVAWTRKPATSAQHSQDDDLRVLRCRGCVVDTIAAVMDPPRWIKSTEWMASRIADAQTWLSSIIRFTELGPEAGPTEDHVWRTIMNGLMHDRRSRNPDGKTLDEQRSSVLRKVMRGEPIDTDQLSEEQEEYIRNGLYWIRARNPEHDLNDHLEFLRTSFTNSLGASSRERTLFKTEKTMLGMGHVAIRTGDIVTLMEGLPSPIILRPRGEDKGGGFTFVGDAYVDGIMYGEFLETHPTWRDFEIY